MSGAYLKTLGGVTTDRWRIVRLVPRAGTGVVATSLICNVLLAAAPVLFVVQTSVLVGLIPEAVRDGIGSPAFARMTTAFAIAAVALGAQQVLAQAQQTLAVLITRRVDGQIAGELMRAALHSTGLEPLEEQQLVDQLAEAAREVEQGFQSPGAACAGMLALIARYGQLLGCAAVVAYAFSWVAATGLLLSVLVFRYGQRGGLRKYSAMFATGVSVWRRIAYFRDVATSTGAAKEIRVFGLLGWLRERHREAYIAWMRPVWAERRRIYLKPYLGYTALGLLLVVATMVGIGFAAANGRLDLMRLALVVQAALFGLRLADFYPEADIQTQFGMNAYRALREFRAGVLARSQSPARSVAGAGDLAVPRGPIRFERVRFAYPGRSAPVFTDLELTVPAGRCTAIVGLNGAGKTTLVKLLTRLASPDAGRITVAGRPINDIPVARWRRSVAVIFQDYLRYESSAADNIALGSVSHAGDRAGIRSAAQAAGILTTFDRLPSGLDTPLTRALPAGVDLSGGQWQRVAIARALFAVRHGASVLVLDEPTASLDVRAEARFFDEVIGAAADVTTILISHRFATVRRADHIVVLADGQVAEQGTHESLMALAGRYAGLFSTQAARLMEDPAGAHATVDREEMPA